MIKKIFSIFFVFYIIQNSVVANDFTVHKLQNGQTLIIQEIHNNPIVTIDTWIKTGSINETDSNSGVAHFLEHMFFKGTKKHPAGEFDKILESKGALINAATSKDFTHYYITIPSMHFDKALDLHSDMLLNPQIPRKELEQERKVVLEEIAKDGNNPSKKVYENLNQLLYTRHPYKRKVIGSADVISKIRREDLLDFFNEYYVPSNMITVIVGDINTSKVLEKVSQSFNSEYKKNPKKNYKKESILTTQKRNTEYFDIKTGYLAIGFRSSDILNDDLYAMDILAEILGGGKSSKFYKNIKEQKGFAFSIAASNGSYKDDGIFYIIANCIPQNITKLEKAIFDEINYIKKYGITEEELNIAKKKIEQETYYARESTSNIATELGYTYTLTESSNFYKNYLDNIKKIKIKDVQNVANKYLAINKSAISIGLPKDFKKEQITNVQPKIEKISEHSGISKYLLNNSATILISKHSNNDIIAMNIIAKGGEFIEKIPGEGTLTAATLLQGSKKYSFQELSQIMEENGIEINPVCKEDYFAISVKTTTSQINLTFEILNEILNNSLFEDYEIEKKRNEILNKIKQKRDIPMNIALENFKTLIFENSVYSHTNKILEKTLPSITKANILDYYNKIFDSKNIIISINGNINEKETLDKLGNILQDKKQAKFEYNNYKITSITTPKIITKTIKDLQSAWLFLGWQTGNINNKKDFITLKIIDTILGNGMSSRIYRSLREQDGLAYQLGTIYTPNVLAGMFITYIGTNPETLEYSKNKINSEIQKIKLEFVSDEELKDAKEKLKGNLIVALETNDEKAATIGLFEALGFGYDFFETYIRMIDETTASDIIRVSNKYFNKNYIESTVK